ncbi:hypothetical protein MUO98_03560 [Candidatus Bathyarchaeota archaeon]|nr:hypothetical protein [Candidatus Bathyarchaeota archaeon]
MDVNQVNELGKKAFQKIQCGDFEGALKPAYEILDLGPHYFVSYTTSALLIDIGNALGDETITKQGVELLENDLKEIVQHDEKAPSAYYNLANAIMFFFSSKGLETTILRVLKRQN